MNKTLQSFLSCFFFLGPVLWTTPLLSAEMPPTNSTKPIDAFQPDFDKTYRSKSAQNTKRAYDAYLNKQFKSAILLANKIKNDKSYSDYGYWIASLAHRQQALQFKQKRNYPRALTDAKSAISNSLQIEAANPYSPFIKLLPRDLSQSELIVGDCYWGTRKWAESKLSYESGFQRLLAQNSLSFADPLSLEHYAEGCKKKPTPLCQSWILKLVSSVTKPVQMGILKYFPTAIEDSKSPHYASRSSTPYKAPDLDQAAFDISMKFYIDEKYSAAEKAFQQFLTDFPRSGYRHKARYWLGRSLIFQKEPEKAQQVYSQVLAETPMSYYGLLASQATEKSMESIIGASLPLAADSDPFLLPHEMIHLQRARQLIAEKAPALAAYELKDLKPRDALSSPFLLYLAMLNTKVKNHNATFNLVGELIQRGYEGVVSTYGLKMIFPVAYLDLINKYALESSLDPVLVISLIKQESAFSEEANSSSGAMGLMQLMPNTALEVDSEVKIPDLVLADINIRIGTQYLKKLLTRYNGNIAFALAGYNAGPNAVDRWLKDPSTKRGLTEFIESIPYKETREYVAAIVRNYFWYSHELKLESKKSLNYFWNVYGPPEDTPNILPKRLAR